MFAAVAHEQAQTPGEKSLGVAVLGMVFFPIILVLGFGGLFCLIVSAIALVVARMKNASLGRTNEPGR